MLLPMNKSSLISQILGTAQRPTSCEANSVKVVQQIATIHHTTAGVSRPIQVSQAVSHEHGPEALDTNLLHMYELSTWRMYNRIARYRMSRSSESSGSSPPLDDEDLDNPHKMHRGRHGPLEFYAADAFDDESHGGTDFIDSDEGVFELEMEKQAIIVSKIRALAK
jgi:hypothetical protein